MAEPEAERRRASRLDLVLVARGLAPSRARARDLIRRGLVEVAGVVEMRPAVAVAGDVRVLGEAAADVSRGAEKLRAALDHFRFPAEGRIALDLGASTG